MKNRKNKTQQQEVRRILEAMRQELKDYNLHYEDLPKNRPVLDLSELINRVRNLSE